MVDIDYLKEVKTRGLDDFQISEVTEGLKKLTVEQVDIYAWPKYDHMQMQEIRLALEEGLSEEEMSVFLDPSIDWKAMNHARVKLQNANAVDDRAKAKLHFKRLQIIFIAILIVLCLGAAGFGGYYAWQYFSAVNQSLELELTDTDITVEYGSSFNPADYDIKVYDDLNNMFEDIKRLNLKDNKARMLAGYCWNWISKDNHAAGPDIVIENQHFSAYWNFSDTSTWAIDSNTVDQVGCIHTSQGLEFSYVGVIIGDDMRYENGHVITDASKRAKTDASLRGIKAKGEDADLLKDKIIRDTYKTLLSRAMKGCYVYCTDKALAQHIKDRLSVNQHLFYDFSKAVDTGMMAAEKVIIR